MGKVNLPQFLQGGAKWLGFIGSILTFTLGVVHVCDIGARVHWPPSGRRFIDDTQQGSWRAPLFSLVPAILCTPTPITHQPHTCHTYPLHSGSLDSICCRLIRHPSTLPRSGRSELHHKELPNLFCTLATAIPSLRCCHRAGISSQQCLRQWLTTAAWA